MRWWHALNARVRSLVRRGQRESDLQEELRIHIDRDIERLQSLGVPAREAREQALRTFGGVAQIQEDCRDARGTRLADALRRDARHAVRRLVHDWRFTSAAVLILGLGIGANTAIFSLVNAALFRQQSMADRDGLVDLYQNGSNDGGMDANSYPAYEDMAAHTNVFSSTTAVFVPRGVSYLDDGSLRSAIVEHTTSTYPATLGLQPWLGRWFGADEDQVGAPVVAVVGHDAWLRKFGADPAIIGRTIRIEGVPVTIVGVGPVGHHATVSLGIVTDFWMPIASIGALGAPPRTLERRPEEAAFFVKARLRPDVTVAQAQAAMNVLGARLAADYPDEDPGKGISVVASNDVRVHPQMDGLVTAVAAMLLVVVGLVLAIACSNLATLLLVRGTARAREVSVRLALGATRRQLVGHLLTESLLLSLAGGLAGCLLAWWAIRLIGAIELPVVVDLSLDARVLAFAVGISIVTGVAFGLAPALKATRVDLVRTLRGDGDTRQRESRWFSLKNGLVVFQVAVSVVLIGVTSVFIQLMIAAQAGRAGFAVDGVAMVETDARYADGSSAAVGPMLDEMRRRVGAIPGVQAAVIARGLPMQLAGAPVIVEGDAPMGGRAVAARSAASIWAGPGFFDALRIPILVGRALDERDTADAPRRAVISEAMARQYFGGDAASAVGRRFRIERDADPDAWIEVVGVARDAGTADLQGDIVSPIPQVFYRPFEQWHLPPTTVIARTSLDAEGLVVAMQRELRAVNPALPVLSAKTMAQYLDESLAGSKAMATLIGGLGALGLALAGIGLYAVIAFAVTRRSREIGIRIALGAPNGQVVWTVAREVAVLVGAGTAVGLGLTVVAILAAGSVNVSTPGISLYRPTVEPLALILIAAFMAATALAAACVPAWRAVRMDPLVALRRD